MTDAQTIKLMPHIKLKPDGPLAVGTILYTCSQEGAVPCDGRTLDIQKYRELFDVIGREHSPPEMIKEYYSWWRLRKFFRMRFYDLVPNPEFDVARFNIPDLR